MKWLLAPLLLIAGCPGPSSPLQLWIALNGSEASIKLQPTQPPDF